MNTDVELLASRICNGLIMTMTAFLLASMLVYSWKKQLKVRNSEQGKMFAFCFICIISTLPGRIVDEIILNAKSIPGAMEICDILFDLSSIFIIVSNYLVYFFLWLRQRAIYSDRRIAILVKKPVVIFSYVSVVAMTLYAVAYLLGTVIPNLYEAGTLTCVRRNLTAAGDNATAYWESIRIYVLGSGLFFFQCALLALFLYPMIKIRSRTSKNVSENDQLSWIIRRSLICTAVSVLSDAILILVLPTFILNPAHPPVLDDILYASSVFVNDSCILMTFKEFPDIIFALCNCRRKRSVGATAESKAVSDFTETYKSTVTY